jgi:putative endonuclease
MERNYSFYVYIMANSHDTVLYTGVTNEIESRVCDHKAGRSKFTAKYNCTKLVYFEQYTDVRNAIHREKQLKKWKREWKLELIRKSNPYLEDLARKWFE